jgi:hypothetical protein
MSISAEAQTASSQVTRDEEPPGRGTIPRWRRWASVAAVAVAAVGLFLGYLRMAWAHPINADGASNAMQASELLHGNLLLHGWTLSDVSFYSTELIQYALLQPIVGFNPGTIHIAAAMTYTLLVLLVAALAKGRATGWNAAVRVGIAVAVMLVPAPGIGYQTLLSSPNHTGTGVPMVITWLVLDRALTARREPRRWLPFAIAVLLAWGVIGDPLVTFVGAAPLVVVSAVRLLRTRQQPWSKRWRGLDAQLILAGAGSVVLAHGFLLAVRLAGGFTAPAPPISVAQLPEFRHRIWMIIQMLGAIFGAHRPGEHLPAATTAGDLLHLVGILLVACALVVVVVRALRSPAASDRVSEILAVAILANLGAELVSTLPIDIMAAREIVAVLPLGAALAGRVCAPRLRAWRLTPALGVLLVLFAGSFVLYAPARAPAADNQDIAEWLDSRGLRYGLASYWNASNITLATNRRVTVVPVSGGDRVIPYCWQSRNDWYDAGSHDARFVIFDRERPMYGTVTTATGQFGAPVEQHDFGRHTVLMYDHNLLNKLPPPCP